MRFIPLLYLLLLSSLFGIKSSDAQTYNGIILDAQNNNTVAFVNIGIINKNTGTVSDRFGKFELNLNADISDTDTLKISCIGYEPIITQIGLVKKSGAKFHLKRKTETLHEVIIHQKKFKEKRFGIKTKSHAIQAGFKDNTLGYECGILMKNTKTAILQSLEINVASCTYDSIFYRVNIYKAVSKTKFENILLEPMYLKIAKEEIEDKILVDISEHNIEIKGNFLVTLEHITGLGNGTLYFCASFHNKTYYRKTSQDNWRTKPVGISFSVNTKIEKK